MVDTAKLLAIAIRSFTHPSIAKSRRYAKTLSSRRKRVFLAWHQPPIKRRQHMVELKPLKPGVWLMRKLSLGAKLVALGLGVVATVAAAWFSMPGWIVVVCLCWWCMA